MTLTFDKNILSWNISTWKFQRELLLLQASYNQIFRQFRWLLFELNIIKWTYDLLYSAPGTGNQGNESGSNLPMQILQRIV